jgi:hypothetical protein
VVNRFSKGENMGWSATCILVNEREPGYLGSFPQHDSLVAHTLVKKLGLGPICASSISNLDAGLSPKPNWICVGAYSGASILAGVPGLIGCVERSGNPLLKKLLEAYPRASLLLMELASSNNHFGYAYFFKGSLMRALAGDAQRGIVVNFGDPQPEEISILAAAPNSEIPKRGEALAFGMSQRFFGFPFDRFPAEKLTVEMIEVRKPVWPFSLFNKSKRS